MPWSLWSFVFQRYLRAFDPTASRLLRQVETVDVDNTGMTDVERLLSIQLSCVLALTCRGKALQVVRRVSEGFGFEAWKLKKAPGATKPSDLRDCRYSRQSWAMGTGTHLGHCHLRRGGRHPDWEQGSPRPSLSVPVFRHDSKECSKPSYRQREGTIRCRQSINGRAE